MAKKKNVEAPAIESAPEVTTNETTAPVIEQLPSVDVPAPKSKKTKKPKAATSEITLEDLATLYIAHLDEVGKSHGTLFSYRLELVTALDELGKETKLTDLTPARVLEFFTCDRVMKTRTGAAKARPTFVKTQRVLRLALVWAADSGLIERAPLPEDAATF
jgi:hypothetical protein